MAEDGKSDDINRKVRIRLKTDPKQDPSLLKSPKEKSTLRLDGEYSTPDSSVLQLRAQLREKSDLQRKSQERFEQNTSPHQLHEERETPEPKFDPKSFNDGESTKSQHKLRTLSGSKDGESPAEKAETEGNSEDSSMLPRKSEELEGGKDGDTMEIDRDKNAVPENFDGVARQVADTEKNAEKTLEEVTGKEEEDGDSLTPQSQGGEKKKARFKVKTLDSSKDNDNHDDKRQKVEYAPTTNSNQPLDREEPNDISLHGSEPTIKQNVPNDQKDIEENANTSFSDESDTTKDKNGELSSSNDRRMDMDKEMSETAPRELSNEKAMQQEETHPTEINHKENNEILDTPSTKISIKVRRKTDEGTEESEMGGGGVDKGSTEKQREASVDDSSMPPTGSQTTWNSSDVTITSRSDSILNAPATAEDETSNIGNKSTNAKYQAEQGVDNHHLGDTIGDNNGGQQQHDENPKEGTKDGTNENSGDKNLLANNGVNTRESSDGERDPLRRTTASENLKINELKKRVRPGQYFIVKATTDCYSVRWAEQRKVFAYKVGSKNTARFSTVLIETAEKLESASLKRPSILSEFMNPTTEAKGSLLSTYLAGSIARQSIRCNVNRDAETNTDRDSRLQSPDLDFWTRDDWSGNDSREPSPEYNLWAKDHFSPDHDTFRGTVTKEATAMQLNNNYNYPFLTDYDVSHERKGNI